MKILLINLKEPLRPTQKQSIIPPIGLWGIRSIIRIGNRQFGHRCFMHDENLHNAELQIYLEFCKYDIIGISARFSIQHERYKQVASMCRFMQPNAHIIAGGIHAITHGKVDGVDEICAIPGEQWFAKKLNIENYSNIYPQFSLREIKAYWKENKPHDLRSKTKFWIPIETSRGCINSCTFCATPALCGNHWKPFDKKYITSYLKYLRSIGVQELFIEDDNISLGKKRFLWLINQFHKYGMWWSCPNGIQTKHLLDEKIIKALKKSTCWRLSLPFETGCENTAINMRLGNKWLNHTQADELIKRLNDIGILTCGFFIIGYPGETRADIEKTLAYANSLPLQQRNIYIATPYPGTDLYSLCKKKGYINTENMDDFYRNLMYTKGVINTEFLTSDEIEKIKSEDRGKALRRNCQ